MFARDSQFGDPHVHAMLFKILIVAAIDTGGIPMQFSDPKVELVIRFTRDFLSPHGQPQKP